jgi:hypothetical protein
MVPDDNGEFPRVDPVDGIAALAAYLMIYLDRALAHVVKWRPRWCSRTLAKAVGRSSRITTGADDW